MRSIQKQRSIHSLKNFSPSPRVSSERDLIIEFKKAQQAKK